MMSPRETRPDHPAPLIAHRSLALREYVEEVQLSREHERFLWAVVEGKRGEGLRHVIGPSALDAAERHFEHRAGMTVYRAAIEVLRRASARPEGRSPTVARSTTDWRALPHG